MNHWNYTQMLKSKPGIDQREKENLTNHMMKFPQPKPRYTRPDYSHLPHDIQDAIGDST